MRRGSDRIVGDSLEAAVGGARGVERRCVDSTRSRRGERNALVSSSRTDCQDTDFVRDEQRHVMLVLLFPCNSHQVYIS